MGISLHVDMLLTWEENRMKTKNYIKTKETGKRRDE